MHDIRVYSPAHLSTIFCPYRDSMYLGNQGSKGTGITIEEGLTTDIQLKNKGGRVIMINGEIYDSTNSKEALELLRCKNVVVNHNTRLPIASGNGASAAMTVNIAFGLYNLTDSREDYSLRPESFDTILEKCHMMEVRLKTGLGDIGPMFYAKGIDFRTRPGFEGYKNMISIPYQDENLLCFYLGQIKTSEILNSDTKHIENIAKREIRKLSQKPYFENFIECSKRFAKDSKIMPERLENILKHFDNASMIMIGNSGFIFGKDEEYEKLLSLNVPKEQIFNTKISKKGTTIIK